MPAADDVPSTEVEGDKRLILLRYAMLACKASKKEARLTFWGTSDHC